MAGCMRHLVVMHVPNTCSSMASPSLKGLHVYQQGGEYIMDHLMADLRRISLELGEFRAIVFANMQNVENVTYQAFNTDHHHIPL